MRLLSLLLPVLCAADLWAVIVNTSKFWFNYRHTVNLLLTYNTLRRYGLDDDHIILMTTDTTPCNARNPMPTQVYDGTHSENLNQGYLEIDYRGNEVTPEAIVRVLTDRHPAHTPLSKRLRSGPDSNVLVFMNGHGGNGYLKVQDTMVLLTPELTQAVTEMREKRRFKELLVVVDTCQAFSLFSQLDFPDVHMIGSSLTGEMAKSIGHHSELGLSTGDRFTFYTYQYLRDKSKSVVKRLSVANWLDTLDYQSLQSHVTYKSQVDPANLKMKDFFVARIHTFEPSGVHASFSPVEMKRRTVKTFQDTRSQRKTLPEAQTLSWVSCVGLGYFAVIFSAGCVRLPFPFSSERFLKSRLEVDENRACSEIHRSFTNQSCFP